MLFNCFSFLIHDAPIIPNFYSPPLLIITKHHCYQQRDVSYVCHPLCLNHHRSDLAAALQPWTPCLPIRGGKLKASKPFSTSNPQLPFICPTSANYGATHQQPPNQSLNSLNSSYIWREATPNNFNLYSASIPSLNSYRYSSQVHQQAAVNAANQSGPSSLPNKSSYHHEPRSLSEDRTGGSHKTPSPAPPTPFQQVCKYKTASNYDNLYITACNTPILSRKSSGQLMAQRHSNASSARTNYQNYPFPPGVASTVSGSMGGGSPFLYSGYGQSSYIPQLLASGSNDPSANAAANAACSRVLPPSYKAPSTPQQAFLYDRRVNRSFDSPQEFARGSKVGPLRRSTPHLVVTGDNELDDPYHPKHSARHYHYHSPHQTGAGAGGQDQHPMTDSSRNSAASTSGCCGNFVFKQWRKYHNYE